MIGDATALGEVDCQAPIYCIAHYYYSTDVDEEPPDPKTLGPTYVPRSDREGKSARTIITPLFYDERSNTSVVECRLFTGRTHQIRVHLRSLGHPIANDPNYGGTLYNGIISTVDPYDIDLHAPE